jgi:hypothetical protein
MKLYQHSSGAFVFKARDPKILQGLLEGFGLKFKSEKHGNGPEHVSTVSPSGVVLEIYPEDPEITLFPDPREWGCGYWRVP